MDRLHPRGPVEPHRSGALLLGIDIGTTLTKVGVVGVDGSEIVQSAEPTPWHRDATGGYFFPEVLLDTVLRCTAATITQSPSGDFIGVGVTSMAETAVLLDESSTPVGPAIAWFDVRAREEFARMKRDLGADIVARTTGLATSQIPTVATIQWLRHHVDESRTAVSFVAVADWIVSHLCGELFAEMSLASRTGALDIVGRQWWGSAVEWVGLRTDDLLPLRQAGTPFGTVTIDYPGLERLRGAVVTSAGHDHLCASVGVGVNHSGSALDSCGTAEALLRPASPSLISDVSQGHPMGIEVGWHVIADHYALIGGLSLGLNLLPVLEKLGVESRGGQTVLDVGALALLKQVGDVGEVGERLGVVSALRERLDVVEMVSAYEGVSPEQIWLNVMRTAVVGAHRLFTGLVELGGPISEVRISGGWSRNPVLRVLKSQVFPPLSYPLVKESGIRGAALLAALAAGVYADPLDLPGPAIDDQDHHISAPSPSATHQERGVT